MKDFAKEKRNTAAHSFGHINFAMVGSVRQQREGGIDLTAPQHSMEIRHSGMGIKFHMNPAQLAQLQNAAGFTPVIIDIQPIMDLKSFLGIVN